MSSIVTVNQTENCGFFQKATLKPPFFSFYTYHSSATVTCYLFYFCSVNMAI